MKTLGIFKKYYRESVLNQSFNTVSALFNAARACYLLIFLGTALLANTSFAASKLYFVHNDHLGTPQVLTDENQQVVWEVESQTPFGITQINEDPDGDGNNVEFNLRFPGQYYDKETNTNYNYYRTYDPSLGRYFQSDPIGLNGGVNTYGYGLQNPLRFSDFYGLDTLDSILNGEFDDYSGSELEVVMFGDMAETTYTEMRNYDYAGAIDYPACVTLCMVFGKMEEDLLISEINRQADKWEDNLCRVRKGGRVIKNKVLNYAGPLGKAASATSTAACVLACSGIE